LSYRTFAAKSSPQPFVVRATWTEAEEEMTHG
jgi:hypothetical protein